MASADHTVWSGRAPSQGGDPSQNAYARVTKYGDQWVQPLSITKDGLAQEGRYYVVTNPTIGTTVAFPVAASFSDTAPFFLLQNNDAIGGRMLTLDYLRLFPTVVPASGTSARLVARLDSALRTPTAGSPASLTPQNTNMGQPNDSNVVIYADTGGTAMTVPAGSGVVRTVGNLILRSAIPVQFDEILACFGQELMMSGAPTTASQAGSVGAPLVVPPGCSLALHLFFPSNVTTGLSAEYELGLWMR